MTDAINFFQSIFSFSRFAPAGRPNAKLVRELIRDAKTLAEIADAEAAHGATADQMRREAEAGGNESLTQNMATIAAWHFERSLEKYQRAAARYNEAGKIQTKNSRVFFAEAKTMAKRADEIAAQTEAGN